MRSFIEKLAKLIETEGVRTEGGPFKVFNFSIGYACDMSALIVANNMTQERARIKLYEEERDILRKAFDRCEEKTTDSIIEQLNNL